MADQDELRQLADRDGIALPDALAEHGVDLDTALDARSELESAAAYLELHIEQGPVLESLGPPARRRPRHVRRRASPNHLARAGSTCRIDSDGQAPRRARGCGEARARDPRHRAPNRRWRRLHVGRRRLQAGNRDIRRGDGRATPRSARPQRAAPRRDARRSEGGERAVRGGGVDRGRLGADLVDRADPLRRDARSASARRRSATSPEPRTGFRLARSTTPPRCRAPASRR